MAMEKLSLKMEANMKVNGKMINIMDLEFIDIKMEINIKDK